MTPCYFLLSTSPIFLGILVFPAIEPPEGLQYGFCCHVASDLPWRGQSPAGTLFPHLYVRVLDAGHDHTGLPGPHRQFLKLSHKKPRYRPVVQNVESGYGPVFCCTEGRGSPRLVHPLT